MKKRILLVFAFCFTLTIFAQEKEVEEKEGWETSGKIIFLFNQSAFSNWVAGGENTLAGNLGLNYDFNYKKDNILWNNRILASYGLTKSKNTEFTKKTDDNLEINSLVGFKAKNYWSYSIFLNFKTQFADGYQYGKDENGKEIRTKYTKFLSPGYLSFGPGILWEKSPNLKFNLSPIAARFVFANKEFTNLYDDYFGVDPGKNLRFEFGFRASFYAKYEVVKNVTMEHILALYSNYLDKPQNIDLDYNLNIDMKINEVLSANFIFQTIYDDNAFKGFQIREVFGLGVNYIF